MAICALLVPHEPHPYPVYYGDFATTPTIQHCKGIVAPGSTESDAEHDVTLEYAPGHRWVDRDGAERWFVQSGVIAPGYVDEYMREGGEVIYREVGPWQVYQMTEPSPGHANRTHEGEKR